MKVYILNGACGEYSDNHSWIIKAYTKKEDAEQHLAAAEAVEKDLVISYPKYRDVPQGANPYDPEGSRDYTGSDYWIDEVDLEESFQDIAIKC